jgi:AhpD family alkylhydroperoxidase
MPPRVTQITTIDAYPHDVSTDERRAELENLFSKYTAFTGTWTGPYAEATTVANSWSQIFHVPPFAMATLDMTGYVLNEMPWSQRLKLRELALIALYQRQRCDYAYRAHLKPARDAGVTDEQIADLPVFRTSPHFDDEERDVVDFTYAAVDGQVSDELFRRLHDRYGEQGVVELTIIVAFWAMWGIIISTLRPDYGFAH